MDLKDIEDLIRLMEKSNLEEIEWEKSKEKIRLKKFSLQSSPVVEYPNPFAVGSDFNAGVSAPTPSLGAGSASKQAIPPTEGSTGVSPEGQFEVRSPFVGTFYSAPSPGSPDYVEVGEKIKKGDILCIIEAMKIMNEIDAEVSGKVVKILVKNEQAVQYGQVLFLIESD